MTYLSQKPMAGSNPNGPDTRPKGTESTRRWTQLAVPSFIAAATRRGWGDFLASLTAQRIRRLRPTHVLIRIAIIGLAVIFASGVGHALFHPVRDDSQEAAQVVTSLVGGRATLDTVPASFEEELGYRPVAASGTLVNPNGGCSTPGGVGPDSFDTACRVHDFGYDMLRYAEGTGTSLGAWARFDLDRRLYADLLRACDTVTCRGTASVYYTAVTVNSIRQGYVAPTTEPTLPWAGVVVSVVGVAMVSASTKGDRWDRLTDHEGDIRLSRPKTRCSSGGHRGRRHRTPARLAPRPGECCFRGLFCYRSDHLVLGEGMAIAGSAPRRFASPKAHRPHQVRLTRPLGVLSASTFTKLIRPRSNSTTFPSGTVIFPGRVLDRQCYETTSVSSVVSPPLCVAIHHPLKIKGRGLLPRARFAVGAGQGSTSSGWTLSAPQASRVIESLERASTAPSARFPLVYNQSWEDPAVDLAAAAPVAGQLVLTIASGGCNVLHLALTGATVVAFDRNPAQVLSPK